MTDDKTEAKRRTMEALDRLLDEGILPVAKGIAGFALKGLIPVVIFEPGKAEEEILRGLFKGWKPSIRLVGISRKDFARTIGTADHVTANWGARPRPEGDFPVFVFWNGATLLLNHVVDRGWNIEPGSTDAEMADWRMN